MPPSLNPDEGTMKIDEALEVVKGIHRLYSQAAVANPDNQRHSKTAEDLDNVVQFLLEKKRQSMPIPKDIGDISDLPPELLNELSVVRTDELEDQILSIMHACEDGVVNIDQVLVGLYRNHGVIKERRFLQNKLYRMSKKAIVFPVPGERAVYSLDQLPPAKPTTEVKDVPTFEELFGDDEDSPF
jgi:hypothetical protein